MDNDDLERPREPNGDECSAPEESTQEPARPETVFDGAAYILATDNSCTAQGPDAASENPSADAPASEDVDEILAPEIGVHGVGAGRPTPDLGEDPNTGAPASEDAGPGAGAVTRSPGLSAVMDAVSYTNKAVLSPPQETDLQMGAKTLADQSAAMLLEDVRAFAQGIEQILIPATAQALAKVLADDEKPLKTIEGYMPKLAEFVGKMTDQAVNITKDFK